MKRSVPIVAAFLLASCGGTSASVAPSTVSADLKEFSITLDSTSPAAGTVTFRVTNSGTIDHEFIVVKTDLAAGALPVEAAGVVAEDGLDVIGEEEGIAAGATVDLPLTLPAGHYVVFCNIEGHYAGGMRTEVTTR